MKSEKERNVLNASEKTAFRYRIDGGMDERDKDEYESMDSGYVLGKNWPSIISGSVDLHHRMNYLRKRNLGFSFIRVKDPEFEDYLTAINPGLPKTLAYMLSDLYRDGTAKLSDLLENVGRKNPANFGLISESRPYHALFRKFLQELLPESQEYENDIFDRVYLSTVPADKFGCTSLSGDRRSGYFTDLLLEIKYYP